MHNSLYAGCVPMPVKSSCSHRSIAGPTASPAKTARFGPTHHLPRKAFIRRAEPATDTSSLDRRTQLSRLVPVKGVVEQAGRGKARTSHRPYYGTPSLFHSLCHWPTGSCKSSLAATRISGTSNKIFPFAFLTPSLPLPHPGKYDQV